MTRKRKDEKLPKYVYATPYGFIYKPYLGKGIARPTITLAPKNTKYSDVWQAYEQIVSGNAHGTLEWMLGKYLDSPHFAKLKDNTRKEQIRISGVLKSRSIGKQRTFGSVSLASITPGVLTRYMDKRESEGAPVMANRELALISKAWNWLLARDLSKVPNPCSLVERRKESARQHYATDRDYTIWIDYLKRQGPTYLWVTFEIAYLCRVRKHEVLQALKSNQEPEGLFIKRSKGSKSAHTRYSERLNAALAACREDEAGRFRPELVTHKGRPVNLSSFDTMRQRRMKACVKEKGITPFTHHDMKRKGATDSNLPATESTGNTPAMDHVYDVSTLKVEPTK